MEKESIVPEKKMLEMKGVVTQIVDETQLVLKKQIR